jgi:hypothetical protein
MPAKKKVSAREIRLNDDLPILYVDTCAISRRVDGFNYLSFATNTPNTPKGIVEQVRLIIDDESLHEIIDDLCRTTNYFVEKPRKKTKRRPK